VQGVGFRPYVHRLARRYRLSGFVQNRPNGVFIELEGQDSDLSLFLSAFESEAPPLVRILHVEQSTVAPTGETGFQINDSEAAESAFTLVPADMCVCEDCLAETRDPADRRYDYPFTNCTNCGPRYSIIRDIPYDRPATTMSSFVMCDACRAEYEDPEDRRFHAQPNACPVCGPRIRLVASGNLAASGNLVASGNRDSNSVLESGSRAVLEAVGEILLHGGIVAWKGLGGYQLACDARQSRAVAELRRRKKRNDKAFAVMVEDIRVAESLCFVSNTERAALVSRERPIVLLRRRPDAALAQSVSPANPLTGVMLPCTPMHDLLFRVLRQSWREDAALVMTSGNVSEEPIVIDEVAAEQKLSAIADAFVHHDRPIHTRVDDSIARVFNDQTMILRRARGYTPEPIWLGTGDTELMAAGAQQKSTLCLSKAGFALPSQHLGDLENYETLQFYEETLARMQKLFHVHPTVVAHDMHPGYLSTQFALKLPAERHIPVQHHHAHIAACMAEHQLQGDVIGVAWDGTGFGTDGTIWGGEFLAASYQGFDRYAHLKTIPLAGGDTAVREPWRVALSYLVDAFDGDSTQFDDTFAGIANGLDERPSQAKIKLVESLLRRRLHTIETSSCGRLFDAVASLIGLRQTVSFEGQAAMELESLAEDGMAATGSETYEFLLDSRATGATAPSSSVPIDMRAMIRQILEDRTRGISSQQIAAKFHNTLVNVVTTVCVQMRRDLGLTRVCLGGGCFQNMVLLSGCVAGLQREGFEVFYPIQIPANDGGISLGQAAIASELVRQGV